MKQHPNLWGPYMGPSAGTTSTKGRSSASRTFRAAIFWPIGFIGGVFGGLLGTGGGSAIVPLLLIAGTLRPAQVSGTALATVLVISTVGSGAYASLGHLNLGLAWPIAMGSVVGSILGALTAKRLSMRLMVGLFVSILPYFAIKELWPSFVAPEIATSTVSLVLLGIATGFVSGLLGISGASLLVPSLVGFFMIDHHAAQGIAMNVALADSIAGTATHARVGNINCRVLLYLAAPAIVATGAGAILSHSLSGSALRILYGIFMITIWAIMVVRWLNDYMGSRGKSPDHRNVIAEERGVYPPHTGRKKNCRGLGRNYWRYSTTGTWRRRTMSTLPMNPFIWKGNMNTGSVANAMLVFVPLAIMGELLGFGPVFVFGCTALSCIPLSYWLGQATEALGTRFGPVSGGLLNATFGNAAELIISTMALSHGLFIVVRTSLIGSVLGQLLLVLGTSLLVAGLKHKNLRFSRALVQINFTLMAIALVAIGLPSLLQATSPENARASLRLLTVLLSVLLLIIYGFAVVFSLRTQPKENDKGGGPLWTPVKALLVLAASTGGMILISEIMVGSIVAFAKETGISQFFIGLILIPIFSNVVEYIVAITVALKNRMDLSLTISVGSATQVACMILPVVGLIGLVMGQPTAFVFTPIELIAFAAGLVLMVPVLLDGFSNWLEGAELLTCYVILAAVLWVV